MRINTFDAYSRLSPLQINRLVNFLFSNQDCNKLSKNSLRKAILYAAKERPGFGGYIFCLEEKDTTIGALVINRTGMEDYIPENMLVTMVVAKDFKNQGWEDKLLDYAISYCKGDIGVYIKEPKTTQTFKEHGFEHNNLEMRLKQ